MRLRKAMAFLLGNYVVGFVSSAISSVITFRFLDKASRGDVSLAQSSASILGMLLTLGLAYSGNYLIAREKKPRRFLVTWTAHGLVMTVIFLVAAWPLAAHGSIRYLLGEFPGWTMALPLSLVSSSVFFNLFRGLVVGLERYDRLAYIESGLSAVQALGFVAIWWLGFLDKHVVVGWLIIVTLGRVVVLAGLLAGAGNSGAEAPGVRLDTRIWQEGLRVGSIVFLLNLLGLSLVRSNLYLVNYFYSSRAVAAYSLAMMIAELLLTVPSLVGQIVMSRTAAGAGDLQMTGAWVVTVSRLSRMCFAGSVVALGLYYGAGRFLIPPIFGEQYREAVPILDVLMLGTLPLAVNVIYANFFSGLGYPIWMLATGAAALSVSVIASLLLIPLFGSLGAAVGSLLGNLTMFAWYLRMFVAAAPCRLSDVLAIRVHDWRYLLRATG